MDCPQPAALADLVDGHLSPGELVIIDGHLDACSRCAELVAVAVSASASGSTKAAIWGQRSIVEAGTSFGRYQVRRWLGRAGEWATFTRASTRTKAVWTEYDAERRKQTGRTMPGTTTCDAMANWSVDLHAPVPSLVRIEIRDEWDLRVRPLR